MSSLKQGSSSLATEKVNIRGSHHFTSYIFERSQQIIFVSLSNMFYVFTSEPENGIKTVVPTTTVLSNRMVPPRQETACFAIERSKPVPPVSFE